MTKVYVIMEIGYEYNDEYHSKSENNDGQPYKTVYTNETEARAKLKELTVDWLKYDYLASGFNRYGDGHSYGEFLDALRENGVITKKELTSSLAIWNKENSQSYDEPSRFIIDLVAKLTDTRAFQLDILLNELEDLGIIGYSLVTLELA
mgnify:FL=1